MLLPTVFFMSVIVMTSAIDDVSDDLKVCPLSEELYVFDVTSDASYDDIRCSFGNITVRHSIKVVGENRHIFVALSKDINALRDLTFPNDSVVTQYLMQHLADYFKMYGVHYGLGENDTENVLDDTILTMGELRFIFTHGTHADVVDWRLGNVGKAFALMHDKLNHLGLFSIGAYPPHALYIAHVDLNAWQHAFKDGANFMGGPTNFQHTLKHVVQVKQPPTC